MCPGKTVKMPEKHLCSLKSFDKMSRKSEIEKIHRSIEIRFYLGFDPNVRHVPRQNNKSARLCNATIFFCRKAPLFFEEFWHKCTKSTTALALHIEKTRCMIVARMFNCTISIYWLFHQIFFTYLYVENNVKSHLKAHAGFFRLFMKGIFDPYVLWPFDKKLIS